MLGAKLLDRLRGREPVNLSNSSAPAADRELLAEDYYQTGRELAQTTIADQLLTEIHWQFSR